MTSKPTRKWGTRTGKKPKQENTGRHRKTQGHKHADEGWLTADRLDAYSKKRHLLSKKGLFLNGRQTEKSIKIKGEIIFKF